jgi:hypothetical protein
MVEVASVLETPWTMSTRADLAFPGARGDRPDNFVETRQFDAALFRTAIADPGPSRDDGSRPAVTASSQAA